MENKFKSFKKYEVKDLNKVQGGGFRTKVKNTSTGGHYKDYYYFNKKNNKTNVDTNGEPIGRKDTFHNGVPGATSSNGSYGPTGPTGPMG